VQLSILPNVQHIHPHKAPSKAKANNVARFSTSLMPYQTERDEMERRSFGKAEDQKV
jgi:hypothetical protein